MTKETTATELIDFDDNAVFSAICGPLDHFVLIIENSLDLSISRSGNRLLLQGAEENVDAAAEILAHLKKRFVARGSIEEEDVRGAIRFRGYSANGRVEPIASTQFDEGFRTPKKSVLPRSPRQADFIKILKNKPLSFGLGPAGTGKTYLAVVAAVAALSEGRVDKIILSRPAVEAGERIGFLPGDMKEKVDPYMQPLYDSLEDCLPAKQLERLYESKTIEIAPLAFMRGRTLSRAFVVLDEAQNATIAQMKMFLTRLGSDSHMVITGDETQVDLPTATQSGLIDAARRLKHLDAVGIVQFTEDDVVRHPLVAAIIRAYNQ